METQTETTTCHNCTQPLTIPTTASKLFHTCTKMRTHMVNAPNSRKKVPIRTPELGTAGPHILITDAMQAVA